MIFKALRYKVAHVAVTKIHATLSGDLNVQKEGPSNLRLSFPPNIYWLLRNEFAEMTNLIHVFLGEQQRVFDGDNIIKWGHRTFKIIKMDLCYYEKPRRKLQNMFFLNFYLFKSSLFSTLKCWRWEMWEGRGCQSVNRASQFRTTFL